MRNLLLRIWSKLFSTVPGDGRKRDLDAIIALTLPPNLPFQVRKECAEGIFGMFSVFSMAVIDMLLDYQERTKIQGDMLEIGILKGKSAAFIGRHLRPTEQLTLADIHDQLDRTAIASFETQTRLLWGSSTDLPKSYPDYRRKAKSCRFIHIDAAHQYRGTFKELKIADHLLADDGIIAMDDFANLSFSANIAAIFRYIYTSGTDLRLFLVTDEKGYLCRRSAMTRYCGLVLDRSLAEMRSRGIEATLARTDVDPDYRAFYLVGFTESEGSIYGREIYKGYFRYP